MVATVRTKRTAFTLVELVVVVVIIAILAAVAAPKFFDRATDARRAAALQSLSTLRSAIEMYKADLSSYPTTLDKDILDYLKGPFPTVKFGSINSPVVKVVSADRPLAATDVGGTEGWIYGTVRGELRLNESTLFNN